MIKSSKSVITLQKSLKEEKTPHESGENWSSGDKPRLSGDNWPLSGDKQNC